MQPLLRQFAGPRRVLLAIAAPVEVRAVLDVLVPNKPQGPLPEPWTLVEPVPGVEVLHTGVSKANAAAALARVLDLDRHACVLNVGIAGALPASAPLRVTQTIVADRCCFADEGLQTPEGYRDVASIGFPITPAPTPSGRSEIPCDSRLVELLRPLVDRVAPIATVSTCSATDALAAEIARRTGAKAESMEGAALALVAMRVGVPFAELRAISNLTGDRGAQAWDIPGALGVLQGVLTRLV